MLFDEFLVDIQENKCVFDKKLLYLFFAVLLTSFLNIYE
jgi:hypothetical protein